MEATADERIIDESYKSVFILGREQLAAHVCLDGETNKDAHKSMQNMRITKTDTHIVTESTNGQTLLRVKEPNNQFNIGAFPLDMNPSERNDVKLDGACYLSGKVLDEVEKALPLRKNFSKEVWQRAVIVSISDDGIEIGHSDKQGKPQVDEYPLPEHTATFPPVDQVWANTDPDYQNMFSIKLLKSVLESMEKAGAEIIMFKCWQDTNKAVNLQSVDNYANPTKREIDALLMPMRPAV